MLEIPRSQIVRFSFKERSMASADPGSKFWNSPFAQFAKMVAGGALIAAATALIMKYAS